LNLVMDKNHVPWNFVSIFYDRLGKYMACVQWSTAYFYFFLMLAGVRHRGLLLPAVFAFIWMFWFLDHELVVIVVN